MEIVVNVSNMCKIEIILGFPAAAQLRVAIVILYGVTVFRELLEVRIRTMIN